MSGPKRHANDSGRPILAWTNGVPVDDKALRQLENTARLPIVFKHVAAMPDVHVGIGATVGSVIPTDGAIIPAAVGVDIGCGMMAVETSLNARDLPTSLKHMRDHIEHAVPHGRTSGGRRDKGSWGTPPVDVVDRWNSQLRERHRLLTERHPVLASANSVVHLGTLGTGNHFIEVCLDERDRVWVMLHSGSRGIGNRIGSHFIALAKKDMERHIKNLPDEDLAYFTEGAAHFDDYVDAVSFAQDFAKENRIRMMTAVMSAVSTTPGVPPFQATQTAVNCHHNYVEKEEHFGKSVFVTRKGAVRARRGDLGIIPGSMGARSFIVRGRGNPDSFHSCSHGAGRVMSRTEARQRISVDMHVAATENVECRKDASVVDESPAAYKSIDAVMAAQDDLVEILHTLKQVVCVKG